MEFEEVENIGQRIKEIRKSKSITIQKLSQFTDLSVGYLSNLERNQASRAAATPSISNRKTAFPTRRTVRGEAAHDMVAPASFTPPTAIFTLQRSCPWPRRPR